MDPKLKKYLEGMERRIDKRLRDLVTKNDLKALDKKIEDKTADILEVVRSTGDNTSRIITRIDNDYSYLRQHVDHIFKRVDYLEKKFLK
ncbi:MAG: hypothetical protein Q8Q22_02000 [bacterium]|nr:hypothetical protein [bacterium]MDZ4205847.1 hypothetical protein [Patescibacteria group bacterium]